jgi:hypothetical protein
MKEADLLGQAEVSISEIMGARSWTVTKKLAAQKRNFNYGSVTIKGSRLQVI